MNRPMTAAEKIEYHNYFPNLDVDRARVTDNKTPVYNCIAWTVGVTTAWLWPGPTIQDFDDFYRGYGYTRQSSGPIAAWCLNNDRNQMTHGCVSGAGHGPRWESKCGQGLRIQHGLAELNGVIYGQVTAYYATSKKAALLENAARMAEAMEARKETPIMLLNDHQAKTLKGLLGQVPADVRDEFEEKFQAWKDTWSAGHTVVLSDPSFVKHCDEFVTLAAMNKVDIMPLLIEKLMDPENFLALQLYDALQSEKFLSIPPGSNEEIMLKGEQFRAQEVVRLWLSSI